MHHRLYTLHELKYLSTENHEILSKDCNMNINKLLALRNNAIKYNLSKSTGVMDKLKIGLTEMQNTEKFFMENLLSGLV